MGCEEVWEKVWKVLEEQGEKGRALGVLVLIGFDLDARNIGEVRRVIREVAQHLAFSFPSEALDQLAEALWDCPEFLEILTEIEDAPSPLLNRLATHPDPHVRAKVCGHPNASPDTLRQLYQQPDLPAWCLQALANNPNTPRDTLQKIAHDWKIPEALTRLQDP
ncbi:hypothetical protein TCCBUS3UF1_17310 [Thermus sp. CCB_US3_UF1]|nr:hypothetical protein TCCBUS3UF1_17310 [Thermus sp. CCB_US3_UF1]